MNKIDRCKLKELTNYMRKRNIENDLQLKVRRYVEYMHYEERNGTYKGEIMIKTLSPNLQIDIAKNAYTKILSNIPMFKKFSTQFLMNLSMAVKEMAYAPEETIVSPNDNIDGFFYITNGQVQLCIETSSLINPFIPLEVVNV